MKIVRSERCQVDLKDVFERRAYKAQPSRDVETLLQLDDRDVHDRMVGTVSFSASEAADVDKVNDWLRELLWEGGIDSEIYRMKGVFNIHGSDNMYMLQASDPCTADNDCGQGLYCFLCDGARSICAIDAATSISSFSQV